MRNFLTTDRSEYHSADGPKERGVEKGTGLRNYLTKDRPQHYSIEKLSDQGQTTASQH